MSDYTYQAGRFKNTLAVTEDVNRNYDVVDNDDKMITATPQMRCSQLGLKYDKDLGVYLKTRLKVVYQQTVGDKGVILRHYKVDSKLDLTIKEYFQSVNTATATVDRRPKLKY